MRTINIHEAKTHLSLPAVHCDPFDRALIAQARCRGLLLVTADERLIDYGSPVVRLADL